MEHNNKSNVLPLTKRIARFVNRRILGRGMKWTQKQRQFSRYTIGQWSYGTPTVLTWGTKATLTIGNFCSIADGVTILLDSEHRTDWITTFPLGNVFEELQVREGHPATKGSVSIGSDVWIARDATILSGVKIGDGAVIGACSLVTKDVPPYAIVGGNPAKIIRYRFTEQQIGELVSIAWWNWPLEKIKAAIPLLMSPDISGFIAANKDRK